MSDQYLYCVLDGGGDIPFNVNYRGYNIDGYPVNSPNFVTVAAGHTPWVEADGIYMRTWGVYAENWHFPAPNYLNIQAEGETHSWTALNPFAGMLNQPRANGVDTLARYSYSSSLRRGFYSCPFIEVQPQSTTVASTGAAWSAGNSIRALVGARITGLGSSARFDFQCNYRNPLTNNVLFVYMNRPAGTITYTQGGFLVNGQ